MDLSWLHALQRFDDRRPSVPGEHWLTLGTGLALLCSVPSKRSWWARTATLAAAGALICRAASGRDGLAKTLRGSGAGRS